MIYLILICFLSIGCSTSRKEALSNLPASTLSPQISSDSDSQIKHPPLAAIEQEEKPISSKPEEGFKKWGESIADWSIKRENPVFENKGQSNEEGSPSFFFPSTNAIHVPAASTENSPKKRMTVPMPVMQEEVLNDIITISKLNYKKKSDIWLAVLLFSVILFVFGLMMVKKFRKKGNPFLTEIKKEKTKSPAKVKKPLKKK